MHFVNSNESMLFKDFENTIHGWARLNDKALTALIPIAEEKSKDLKGNELIRANNMLESMRFCAAA